MYVCVGCMEGVPARNSTYLARKYSKSSNAIYVLTSPEWQISSKYINNVHISGAAILLVRSILVVGAAASLFKHQFKFI